MATQQKLRYSDIWDEVNVDAFEEAINWAPEYQRGDNDVGFCVWPENHSHGDTTGKFAIHRDKRVYNCYVCGGGSFLSLVMELKDLDVDEATEWIYQFCEPDMRSDSEFVDEFVNAFRDVEKRVETLPFFNPRVLEKFSDPLEDALEWLDAEREWVPFLENRCILPEVAEEYGLCYGESIRRPAPQKGKFAEEPDYVGPAIIFPHYWQDRLVGWQARWLDPLRPEWIPKYTMTGDFPKENTIYGWSQAIRAQGPVVVVESVPSKLFLNSVGFDSAATFGSNVNEAQLRLLRRLHTVVLAPDNDKAGVKWKESLTEYLKRFTTVRHLPTLGGKLGADIGDFASHSSPADAVNEYLMKAYEPGVSVT